MLKRLSSLGFPLVFVFTLLLLLALTLEAHRIVDGLGTPRFEADAISRAWSALVFAGYFLVMSGYLLTFLASYFLFTRKWPRPRRLLASVALFVGSYVFFSVLLGHDITLTWGALLAAGVLSVLIADAFAEALHRRTETP
jgi:hypothetical protein